MPKTKMTGDVLMARKRKRGSRAQRRAKNKYSQSLNHQLNKRMNSLKKMGESKHEAKKQLGENEKLEGIYSDNTYKAYKQASIQFANWLKEEHDIKHIDDVTKEMAEQYLRERDSYCSPSTVSTDLASINKIYCFDVNKKEAGLQQRSYKNITRSRVEREHDKKYNPKNYEKQIDTAKAFGIRRESFVTGDYRLKEDSIYRYDDKLYVSVIEKGGKFRNVEVREDMQKTIEGHFPNIKERDQQMTEQEFRETYENLGENLFEKYTAKIDNHALRREYAQHKYKELVSKLDNEKQDYYKQYDKRAIAELSKNLGHNRLRVVVEHYLR